MKTPILPLGKPVTSSCGERTICASCEYPPQMPSVSGGQERSQIPVVVTVALKGSDTMKTGLA